MGLRGKRAFFAVAGQRVGRPIAQLARPITGLCGITQIIDGARSN